MLLSVSSLVAKPTEHLGDMTNNKNLKITRGMTVEAKRCVECHADKTPAHVDDWRQSRHAHVGVSCIDCHSVKKDNPMAAQNCPGVKGTKTYVSVLVSPKTCTKCHPNEVEEFQHSGHARAALQVAAKQGMQDLMHKFEGRNHPKLKNSPEATGCMQCHGTIIKLDKNKQPTAETWPNYGIGNVYPDGGVGNCKSCHSIHKFSIAEARKPAGCASCHLGPDHPDIEIYNNSMHGHIFNAEGSTWKYDSAPDAWEPGDYRAPTCATCHMSGIGELKTTHNVSRRLKWNIWAPISKLRDGGYETAVTDFTNKNKVTKGNPLAGHPDGSKAGRAEMEQVCKSCHISLHTKSFFKMADQHVELYNEYAKEAKGMIDELGKKGLMMKDKWADPAFKVWYHLWHHQGRRMRQGALMGGPDYAHWHGVFELQQDIRELRAIYNKRIKTGKIDE
ncbi:multiheme c-type cytochrome [Sulfurimonas sp.]|uniref:multiheme c-type cytochrome n=1 Tax=Sulfurimonas sp. TaxID=2022749 RepID=UPI0026130789|nr:multiheme c-type cytochrome [Sulfurimonas sp.]